MDSITHIVLGACIGDAVLSKKIGKKGMFIGAVAQSFPDIDVVGTAWLSMSANLDFHRGITHSFFFGLLMAFPLAWLTKKIFRRSSIPLFHFAIFFCLQIWLHNVLDTCNAYGTALFEPFHDHRFAWDILFVADPLFSLPMLVASIALLIMRKTSSGRKYWITAGLLLPAVYIAYAISNKFSAEKDFRQSMAVQQIPVTKLISTPTAFNTWLWYMMMPTDTGIYIGYRSVYDSKVYISPIRFYPKNAFLLDSISATPDVLNLLKFSDSIYTVERKEDSLIFNIPRFGKIAGWQPKEMGFNFQFYLNDGFDNTLLIQRGRAKELNKEIIPAMINRIKGYPKYQ